MEIQKEWNPFPIVGNAHRLKTQVVSKLCHKCPYSLSYIWPGCWDTVHNSLGSLLSKWGKWRWPQASCFLNFLSPCVFPAQLYKVWFSLLIGHWTLNRSIGICSRYIPGRWQKRPWCSQLLSSPGLFWKEESCVLFQDYGSPPDTWDPQGQGKSHCFNEEPGHIEPSRTEVALRSKTHRKALQQGMYAPAQSWSLPPVVLTWEMPDTSCNQSLSLLAKLDFQKASWIPHLWYQLKHFLGLRLWSPFTWGPSQCLIPGLCD